MAITQCDGWRDSGETGGGGEKGLGLGQRVVGRKEGKMGLKRKQWTLYQGSVKEWQYGWRKRALRRLKC